MTTSAKFVIAYSRKRHLGFHIYSILLIIDPLILLPNCLGGRLKDH